MNLPLCIVVADDEPDMREYFQKLLPRLGHRVVGCAANGRELIGLCQTEKPDLVITDIKMPDLDGIDAAVQICRERAVPILLVSAYHDPELIARAQTEYVLGFLVKPIRPAELETAIALAVRRFEEFERSR